MLTSDYHFDLPQSLIAQKPLAKRSGSRLLYCDAGVDRCEDRQFTDLVDLLNAGDLLVFNDTRVIPARLFGKKSATGGAVEVLVERVVSASRAYCHIRASKSPKPDTALLLCDEVKVVVVGREGDLFIVELQNHADFYAVLDQFGAMPLPPYIERSAESADAERYQTVYASQPGAVAAPTAGLHFDNAVMTALSDKGIDSGFVTLHVGAGTFQPVRVDNPDNHIMHSERVEVSQNVCDKIVAARARGGRVIAVGTTVVRSLESASAGGAIEPFQGETEIFIRPGYAFKCIDALLTNFHLPESTLLMLVCAFGGYEFMMRAYRHAVQAEYRFFSYGDAMLICPSDHPKQ